jgi:multidrug efflux pump subunit AcrB
MSVNLSGDYDLPRLKKYADDLKDKLEDLSQINRVDIIGAPEREFQINVDNYRMQSAGVTLMISLTRYSVRIMTSLAVCWMWET